MRTRWRRLTLILVATVVAACSGGGGTSPDDPHAQGVVTDGDLDVVLASVTERGEPAIADANDVDAVADATATFGVDLYRQLAAAGDGNVIVSPYSAWLALAMASVGADGGTREELAAALRFPLEEDRLLPAVNALDRSLTHRAADDAVTLSVVNRLWGQRGMELLEPFLDAMVEHFGAPLVAADFASAPDAERATINGWVEQRTRGKIPQLFPEGTIDGTTMLVLVNAVHLDAPWELAFDPEQTAPGSFTRADGSSVSAELMHYDQYLPTALDEEWVAVELPYEGSGLSMVVVVPRDLATFEAGLDQAALDEVFGRLRDGGIHLTMPSFSFSTHASLIEPLRAIGVSSAFDPGRADFSRMTEGGGLHIGAVEHEAFIKVDEGGTEAAAGTGASFLGSHGPTIDVDRPFLFVIRDRATSAILFIGRVLDPSA